MWVNIRLQLEDIDSPRYTERVEAILQHLIDSQRLDSEDMVKHTVFVPPQRCFRLDMPPDDYSWTQPVKTTTTAVVTWGGNVNEAWLKERNNA